MRFAVATMLAAWLLSLGRAGTVIVLAVQSTPTAPGGIASSAPDSQKIVSNGPLTRIEISTDLGCAVDHAGDAAPEFYEDHACATLVAVAGTLYRPSDIPQGDSASPFTAFTPVSQTGVQGSGTSGDPFRIVTVVDVGTTGLRITQTDSYIIGQETYRTDVTIANRGGSEQRAIVYRAGDCYLQNSDQGFGSVDRASGAVSCVSGVDDGRGNVVAGPRIEQWYPLTTGSTYFHAGFDAVWAMIGSQQPFPNTCRCEEYIDNGAGISWQVTLAAGATGTWSQLTGFSPLGVVPLAAAVVADRPSLPASGSGTYTVTITNPNRDPATVATITVDLPAGFSYVATSTRGASTANPTVDGQRLTWAGPFPVGPSGSVSLTFTAIAGPAPGTYTLQGGGTANAPFVVAPTGGPATVTIGGNAPLPDVLPGPLDISLAPEDVARSIGITLFLMLLIAAPTPLFNNTLENNLDEIRHTLRLDRLPRSRVTRALAGGWLGLGIYLAVAAFLYALLDSAFPGPDGLLLYASGLLGLAVGNAAISVARDRYVWTRFHVHGSIKIAQWTLVLAAVCVLITRLTGVQPGYVYGIVATVAFAVPLSRNDEGRMAWLGALALLVMALGAWFLRIPVQPTVGHPVQGLALLADKALVAVFVTGVEGLVFGLIPIRFMIGEPLASWRRWRWLALWGAGILLFAHVILYPVSDYQPNPSAVGIWTVAITVVAYSAVAVGFWWYFRERERRRQLEPAVAVETQAAMAAVETQAPIAAVETQAAMAAVETQAAMAAAPTQAAAAVQMEAPGPAPSGSAAGVVGAIAYPAPPSAVPPPAAPPGWQVGPTGATAVPPAGWQTPAAPPAWPQPTPGTPTAGPSWGYGAPPAAWSNQPWAGSQGWVPPPAGQWMLQHRPAVSGAARVASLVLVVLGAVWLLTSGALFLAIQSGEAVIAESNVAAATALALGLLAFGIAGVALGIGAWSGRSSARVAGIVYALVVASALILLAPTDVTGTPPTGVIVAAWLLAIGHLFVAAVFAAGWNRRA